MIGEAVHFLDTVASIAGATPVSWTSTGDMESETLLRQNFAIQVGFADGSCASILYSADGSPSTGKERIEVLGRGHSAVIDDFSELVIDGKRVWRGATNKGHVEQFQELYRALTGSPSDKMWRHLEQRQVLELSQIIIDCAEL